MIDFGALTLGPCLDAFGEPVLFQAANGTLLQPTAIFDDRYRRTKLDERGVDVVTFAPILGCRVSDFPAGLPNRDELFTVRGVLYRVVETDPDGFGHVLIELKLTPRQSAP